MAMEAASPSAVRQAVTVAVSVRLRAAVLLLLLLLVAEALVVAAAAAEHGRVSADGCRRLPLLGKI